MNAFNRFASAAGISALLMLSSAAASASEDGRNITLGAGAGAITGGVLTHGSAGGIVGGAIAGGVLGHVLTPQKKHYSDNHRRATRRHVEPRRDYDQGRNYRDRP